MGVAKAAVVDMSLMSLSDKLGGAMCATVIAGSPNRKKGKSNRTFFSQDAVKLKQLLCRFLCADTG